jgi:general secretion pathway protein J
LGRPRSTLERVGYRIQDDELVRLVWPELDQARVTDPVEQPLLKGVTRLTVRFLDSQGQWQDQWPPLNQDPKAYLDVLPKGIQVAIDVKGLGADGAGRITRTVELAQ